MKHMNDNRQNQAVTSKKKKSIYKNTNKPSVQNNIIKNKNATFNRIFQSTTILSRSPSHSFSIPSPVHTMNSSFNMNLAKNMNKTAYRNNNYNNQYKKSKSIKISNNSINKGNFMQQSFNNNQYGNQNFNNNHFGNYNESDIAANNLANMLHSELTINLTKHEPRMNLYNQNQSNYSQQINPLSNRSKFFQHAKKHKKNNAHNQNIAQSLSANTHTALNQQRYVNRFKYTKPANVRNHAPYNTTQYIMYDYSKRRGNDQEIPNEIQQFSDDWNMVLATGTASATESLHKIGNNVNNSFIINNVFSLSKKLEEETKNAKSNHFVMASSLGSSYGSNEMNINIGNITNMPAENYPQLSSSL